MLWMEQKFFQCRKYLTISVRHCFLGKQRWVAWRANHRRNQSAFDSTVNFMTAVEGAKRLNYHWSSGGQRWSRTTDTRIFSPLLYQLSYLAICLSSDSFAVGLDGRFSGRNRVNIPAKGGY
jgi:hypothetical protein